MATDRARPRRSIHRRSFTGAVVLGSIVAGCGAAPNIDNAGIGESSYGEVNCVSSASCSSSTPPVAWGGPSGIGVDCHGNQVGCSSGGSTCYTGSYDCYDGQRPFESWMLYIITATLKVHIYTYCYAVYKNTCDSLPREDRSLRRVLQDLWAGSTSASYDSPSISTFLGYVAGSTISAAQSSANNTMTPRCENAILSGGGSNVSHWGQYCSQLYYDTWDWTCTDYSYPQFSQTYNIPYLMDGQGPNCYCYEWQRLFRPAAGLSDGNDNNW